MLLLSLLVTALVSGLIGWLMLMCEACERLIRRHPELLLIAEYSRRRIANWGADPLTALPQKTAHPDSDDDDCDDDCENMPHVRRIYVHDPSYCEAFELNVERAMRLIAKGDIKSALELARRFGYVLPTAESLELAVLVVCYDYGANEYIAAYHLQLPIAFPPYPDFAPTVATTGDVYYDRIVRATSYDWRGETRDCTHVMQQLAGPRQNFYTDAPQYRCVNTVPFVLTNNTNHFAHHITLTSASKGDWVMPRPPSLRNK